MQKTVPDSSAARRGIDEGNNKFMKAFNSGDPASAAQEFYTREACVLPPGADMIRGRDQIAQFWQVAAQQMGIQRIRLSTIDLDVSGDMASEIGRAILNLSSGQEVHAKYVVVWKREDGTWRGHIDIWNT